MASFRGSLHYLSVNSMGGLAHRGATEYVDVLIRKAPNVGPVSVMTRPVKFIPQALFPAGHEVVVVPTLAVRVEVAHKCAEPEGLREGDTSFEWHALNAQRCGVMQGVVGVAGIGAVNHLLIDHVPLRYLRFPLPNLIDRLYDAKEPADLVAYSQQPDHVWRLLLPSHVTY